MVWRAVFGVSVIGAVAFAAFFTWAWHGEIPAAPQHDASTFDPGIVARGAQLAAIGSCNVCHTRPGGRPFAGGYPVETPFGTIYGTNITPDRETGIGDWSSSAFRRAMREGVDRQGHHLYPAFPYDHFTQASDGDIDAVYAFMMSREPVSAANRPPEIVFPLNIRLFAAAWKLLFLRDERYRPDPAKSPDWNRGAYLTASFGHCGACHTPRNVLGAEKAGDAFDGGEGEDWIAPALNDKSPAPAPWTRDAVFNYLHRGWDEHHGHAAGPMAPVVHNMTMASQDDVAAMATYVASLSGPETDTDRTGKIEKAVAAAKGRTAPIHGLATSGQMTGSAPPEAGDGATVFNGACASCHHGGGALPVSRPIDLGLSTSVNAPDPRNLIHIVLDGIHPLPDERGRIMPGFSGALTDRQIVALATYVRAHFSDRPQWPDVAGTLMQIRRKQGS
jgi:mono/diheme cytochrome c family protein